MLSTKLHNIHPCLASLAFGFALALGSTAMDLHAAPARFSYSEYATLLDSYVIDTGGSTRVKYAELKKNSARLLAFNSKLSAVSQKTFDSWSKADQLAFLINSYNSFTLQLIVDNYPVKSIRKIGGFFGNPWKIKFFNFLGEKTNLDHLEQDLLRKNYQEARIHFAINCASGGCPPLGRTPYYGEHLNEQLEAAARRFVSTSKFNRYDDVQNRLYLSSIFKWYGTDFGDEVSMKEFIARHLFESATDPEIEKIKSATIEYLDYDWSLNDAE
ncbi:MAG: DUF547 domain-containing protein [Bdellovibrionota bacterium]